MEDLIQFPEASGWAKDGFIGHLVPDSVSHPYSGQTVLEISDTSDRGVYGVGAGIV